MRNTVEASNILELTDKSETEEPDIGHHQRKIACTQDCEDPGVSTSERESSNEDNSYSKLMSLHLDEIKNTQLPCAERGYCWNCKL